MKRTDLRRYIPAAAGVLLGALAGYLYWRTVGCSSGTCAITARPLNSTAYGALMGYLLSGILFPVRGRS